MCLAIFKPAGQDIPSEYLHNAAETNPDGAGIAYADGDKVHIDKGFFDGADTLIEMLKSLKDKPAIVHLRYSTQGSVDDTNCHPFKVGEWAFAHNGVISKMPYHKKYSDTYLYAKNTMSSRIKSNSDWPLLPKSSAKMAKEIGSSKLVFLRGNGDSIIVNEKKGEWVDGVWYSNDYYKPKTRDSWWNSDPTGASCGWGAEPFTTYSGGYGASVQPSQSRSFVNGEIQCHVCNTYLDDGDAAHIIDGSVICGDCWDEISKEAHMAGWQDDAASYWRCYGE